MSSTGVDRINGIDPSVAVKAPCACATTANITLSGSQTIDTLLVEETTPKTRVLVRSQTNEEENGVYDVYDTAWVRSPDFNGSRDVVDGTLVSVVGGSAYANSTWRVLSDDPIVIGTTDISFEAILNYNDGGMAFVSTFALLGSLSATLDQVVSIKGHTVAGIGGGQFIAVDSGGLTPDGGTISVSATGGIYWQRTNYNEVCVEMFGGGLGGVTDDTTAIQNAINAFPGGKKICMYGPSYRFSSTLYLKYQGIFLVGAGPFATDLLWTSPGGTAIKANSTTAIVNGCGILNMNIAGTSTTNSPDIIIDMSGFSYGTFDNLETTTTRANAVCWKFYSDLGTAPYFNNINNISMFGGADASQTGMLFTNGAWSGGSRGGNANCISNIKRGASLNRLIDLKEGQGNMFDNISGESIKSDMIALNDISSAIDSGTSSAATANTFTDGTKSWTVNAFANYTLLITSGVAINQTRKIVTNTATALTLDIPFNKSFGAGVTYSIRRIGAFENMFSNIRQEGLASNNPNFIHIYPGAIGNKLKHASISSLGSGKYLLDESGHPSNWMANGELVLFNEIITPGASANIDIWTKSSVLGGLAVGSNFSVEYLQVNTPGVVSGTATVTVDVSGATVGSGSPSLQVIMDSVIVNNGFVSASTKEPKSSLNNGLFLNVTTSAGWNAATKLAITVAVRVWG